LGPEKRSLDENIGRKEEIGINIRLVDVFGLRVSAQNFVIAYLGLRMVYNALTYLQICTLSVSYFNGLPQNIQEYNLLVVSTRKTNILSSFQNT
jgi:hypothetical protein